MNDFEFSVYTYSLPHSESLERFLMDMVRSFNGPFFFLEHSKLLARIRNYYFFIQITHFHSLKKNIWHANCKDYLTFFKTRIVSEPAAAEIPTIKLSRSQSYFLKPNVRARKDETRWAKITKSPWENFKKSEKWIIKAHWMTTAVTKRVR